MEILEPGKALVASKTFWLNLAGIAASVGAFIPPPYGMIILAAANVANRLFTEQPISSILPK